MSLRQVIATTLAALQDPATGLAARAAAIAVAEGLANIDNAFTFGKWVLAGEMHQAGSANVSVSPAAGSANLMLQQETQRDAIWPIDFRYETFNADPAIIQDNVATLATALLQVLDKLVEYSAAHGGTIVQVIEPIPLRFGSFSGVSTTNGFTATANIQERGTT